MAIGWQGEKVRLVPLDPAKHLDNAVEWLNDPEVTAWTIVGDIPMLRLAEEDYFRESAKPNPAKVTFAIETLAGEHIGMSGIHNIEPRNGVAMTGTLIGRRSEWGRGYATDAAIVRRRYAFNVLNLRILLSEVMAPNAASIRVLEKAGYREYGRIPKRSWKRGAYRDVVLMMVERENCPD